MYAGDRYAYSRRDMLFRAGAATLLAGRASRGQDFPGLTVRRQEPQQPRVPPFAALTLVS